MTDVNEQASQCDHETEQKIQDLGLTAPRVTPDQIDALVERVVVTGSVIPGTTTTVLHALLDDQFYLDTASSSCVSPENFNAEMGIEQARKKLIPMVRDKLWELEGYRLYVNLQNVPPVEHGATPESE